MFKRNKKYAGIKGQAVIHARRAVTNLNSSIRHHKPSDVPMVILQQKSSVDNLELWEFILKAVEAYDD